MKKFILLFIISVISILPFKVSAVELEKSFEDSVDGVFSSTNLITSYDDNGNIDGYIVYVAYSDFFIKYNLKNELLYKKTDSSIHKNDLSISIMDTKLLLKRVNEDTGDVIWQVEYDNNGEVGYASEISSYGNKGNMDGYLITFKNNSITSELEPGINIMKYDLNGKLLWIKKYENEDNTYFKDSNGDWFRFDRDSEHGIFSYHPYNITKGTYGMVISAGQGWEPILLDNKSTNLDLILICRSYTDNMLNFEKYDYSGKEISTKSLGISSSHWFTSSINSKNVYGEYDGIIIGMLKESTTGSIIKFDYGGNKIWEKDLSYSPDNIIESYDEDGEFNGYVIFGYDEDKSYITKFTYPKKVIESKNSDVEVISEAYPGKVVTLTPKEKEGYIVKRVIVRDSSGKEIEVSSDNTFVMPDDDVSIEVVYEKRETEPVINPDTASTISVVLILVASIVVGSVAVKSRNYLES